MRSSLIVILLSQIRVHTCAQSDIHVHHLTSEIFDSIDFPRDQTLDLQGFGMHTIEHDAFKNSPSSIEMLILSFNSLSFLPESIFSPFQTTLTHLDLQHNQFFSLNPHLSLRNLHQLRVLDLSHNRLIHISAEDFHGLARLDTLILRDNHLTSLSSANFQFNSNLTLLDLSENRITQIDAHTFDFLFNLKMLLLNSNPLGKRSSLPNDLFQPLPSLHYLDLENTQLTSLPSFSFQFNQQLQTIKLRRNHFSTVSSLKHTFCSLQSILEIDLVQTSMRTLDVCTYHQLPTLRRLYLMNNPLDCNCELFYLKYGDLYRLLSQNEFFNNEFSLNRWIHQAELRKYLEKAFENGDLKHLPIDFSPFARCSTPFKWHNLLLNNITGIYHQCRKTWFSIDQQCENTCQISNSSRWTCLSSFEIFLLFLLLSDL